MKNAVTIRLSSCSNQTAITRLQQRKVQCRGPTVAAKQYSYRQRSVPTWAVKKALTGSGRSWSNLGSKTVLLPATVRLGPSLPATVRLGPTWAAKQHPYWQRSVLAQLGQQNSALTGNSPPRPNCGSKTAPLPAMVGLCPIWAAKQYPYRQRSVSAQLWQQNSALTGKGRSRPNLGSKTVPLPVTVRLGPTVAAKQCP